MSGAHKFIHAPEYDGFCDECGFEKSHPNHVMPVTEEQLKAMAEAMQAPTEED